MSHGCATQVAVVYHVMQLIHYYGTEEEHFRAIEWLKQTTMDINRDKHEPYTSLGIH